MRECRTRERSNAIRRLQHSAGGTQARRRGCYTGTRSFELRLVTRFRRIELRCALGSELCRRCRKRLLSCRAQGRDPHLRHALHSPQRRILLSAVQAAPECAGERCELATC